MSSWPNNSGTAAAAGALGARVVELARRLGAAEKAWRGVLERAATRQELSAGELLVLATCAAADDGLDQIGLATALGVSPAKVSDTVERLRRRELLCGSRAADDRRRQVWRLAPAGRTRLEAVLHDLGQWAELSPSWNKLHTPPLVEALDALTAAADFSPDETIRVPLRLHDPAPADGGDA